MLRTMTPPPDFRQRQRANRIALVVVAILIVLSVALLLALRHGIKQEDCFAAGHHTCAPIDESG